MTYNYSLAYEEDLIRWYPKTWCSADHIPHYFNLNVPFNATTLDIKQAYRQLARMIHPDKIKDHKQKATATQASILVANAFDTLSDPVKRESYTVSCRWQGWSDHCQVKAVIEPVLAWENRRLLSERKKQLGIHQQKPWWWEYTPIHSIGLGNRAPIMEGFCTATWVNFAHLVIDNSLPTSISDGIWQHAQQWTSSERETKNITFYQGCEEIVLQFDTPKVIPRWSSIQSDTDWATLGSFADLFCPDILLVPISIIAPITIYVLYRLYQGVLRLLSLIAPHAADKEGRNTTDSPTTTAILDIPPRTSRGFTPYPTPRTLAERPVDDSVDESAELGLSTRCVGTTASKRPCHRKVPSGTIDAGSLPLCFQHRKHTR
jgi:hypothetical protein